MSDAERFLEPGCAELPICRCGKDMYIASTRSSPKMPEADIRVYNCLACDHEMHLAIWRADPAAASDIRTADADEPHSADNETARKLSLIKEMERFLFSKVVIACASLPSTRLRLTVGSIAGAARIPRLPALNADGPTILRTITNVSGLISPAVI
jgi:hypothetical protein